MTTPAALTRRGFIRKTAAAGACIAGPQIVPSSVLGREGHTAPSERITIGFIGIGGHGFDWNLPPYLKHKDAQVVATCDVDHQRLLRATNFINRHYGNTDCKSFSDFRELIARDDIDAVMISTPDHWHVQISMMAMLAGKDVQCEKPTLTIHEGKALVDCVRKLNKVFQTSTEDRSVPVYHRMAELVRNGRIGKLQRIEVILPQNPKGPGDPTPQPVPAHLDYELWLGPAPHAPYTRDRVHYNFRWIEDYSGGIICDWGTHLFDTAQWANDTERSGPVEVEGTGAYWSGGLYNTIKEYDDFLKCARSRKDPYFPVDIGHRVSCVCHMANIAIKLGRKLKWDPEAEKFTGDAEALAMMERPRRDPWQLPEIP